MNPRCADQTSAPTDPVDVKSARRGHHDVRSSLRIRGGRRGSPSACGWTDDTLLTQIPPGSQSPSALAARSRATWSRSGEEERRGYAEGVSCCCDMPPPPDGTFTVGSAIRDERVVTYDTVIVTFTRRSRGDPRAQRQPAASLLTRVATSDRLVAAVRAFHRARDGDRIALNEAEATIEARARRVGELRLHRVSTHEGARTPCDPRSCHVVEPEQPNNSCELR